MTKINYSVIKKEIKKASNVFIMGHKDIDLDAMGSALGIYCYAKNMRKTVYIILDDTRLEPGVKKVVDLYENKINIIKYKEAIEYINKKSLLVVVDTNKINLLQNSDMLDIVNNILVIDHHGKGENTIDNENATIMIDENSSSICEIIANMLKKDNLSIDSDVATVLLSGIVLDTNNFVIKTTAKTYYAAYYLVRCGADPKRVQYLLKQDIKKYIERQKVITEVKVIKNIAISKGLQTEIYRREELAKIADTILLFNNIDASFVIGKTGKNTIAISARSMGKINVGKIMETFGGGGDEHEAATKLKDKSLNEVFEEIVNVSKKIEK